ncbi:MAG TPA: TIGR01777 family oxidoreductase [Candidatus Limnocylindrales bacterium]|nr:TIGR01777 family oxidoreductase [Candidatus Limnocylindrales bacterium]
MTRVVVAGGSGMVGRALVASLVADGVEVVVLSRSPGSRRGRVPAGARTEAWDPDDPGRGDELARVMAGADGVVNTSGEPVGPLPWWLPGRRRAILASRAGTNAGLVAAIGRLAPQERPRVLVTAAGSDGYTGLDATAATEATDVSRTPGFLPEVARAWEAAAEPATALGVRLVLVRTSFVLARGNPLLGLFSLPTRLFLGGPIGGGRQWFSWIHLDDLVGVYRLALSDERVAGPINATSPGPVPQREVARAMGRVLRRPAWFPIPGWPIRLVLGEQATLALDSRRVAPSRLEALGFRFAYPEIETALRDTL